MYPGQRALYRAILVHRPFMSTIAPRRVRKVAVVYLSRLGRQGLARDELKLGEIRHLLPLISLFNLPAEQRRKGGKPTDAHQFPLQTDICMHRTTKHGGKREQSPCQARFKQTFFGFERPHASERNTFPA